MSEPTTITTIRYVQTHDKDVWIPHSEVVDQSALPLFCSKAGSRHTILSVDYDFLAKTTSKPKQAGWLWVDIDHKDLNIALQSAVKFVARLKKVYKLKDEEIHISLSGSKGVHIYLSPNLIYSGEPIHNLAYIYGAMASKWHIPGLDLQIYNEGMGRPVRADNSQRPDGRYKVQVSVKELGKVTAENYIEYVSAPRNLLPTPVFAINEGLNQLFIDCQYEVNENHNKAAIAAYADTPEVNRDLLGTTELPHCITMITNGDVLEEATFDKAKFVLAMYLNNTKLVEPVKAGLRSSMSRKIPSSKGVSESARIGIIVTQEERLDTTRLTTSFCQTITPLLSSHPNCNNCSLRVQLQDSQDEPAETTLMETTPEMDWQGQSRLAERAGGYYTKGAEPRQVTTFLISRLKAVLDENDEGRVKYHTIVLTVPSFGSSYTIDLFPVDAWLSKGSLKQALAGYDGVAFYGNDQDVGNLKQHLDMKDYALRGSLPTVTLCDVAGINVAYRPSKHSWDVFWCEPKYSLDQYLIVNGYKFVGSETVIPSLRTYNPHTPISQQAWRGLEGLTKINTPYNMAILIGFTFYSIIAQHVAAKKLFIGSLSVAGEMGSGKSKAVQACMTLTGLSFVDAGKTLSPAGTSNLPYQKAMVGRGGYPTQVNEMNTKSMSQDRYQYIVELVKQLYDMNPISKGTLGGGGLRGMDNTKVVHQVMRSPVILLGEEVIAGDTVRAVLDRLIPLNFDKRELEARIRQFRDVQENFEYMTEIGRGLAFKAIVTTVESVATDWDNARLPDLFSHSSMGERRKTVYQCVMTGYEWALPVLAALDAPDYALEAIISLQQHLIDLMNSEEWVASMGKQASEVDAFLDRICLMAKIGANPDTEKEGLVRGTHFAVDGDLLLLDLKLTHLVYGKHMRMLGLQTPYRYEAGLRQALLQCDYFVKQGYFDKVQALRSPSTIVLDMARIRPTGLDIDNFLMDY